MAKIDSTDDSTDDTTRNFQICFSSLWKMYLQQNTDATRNEWYQLCADICKSYLGQEQ